MGSDVVGEMGWGRSIKCLQQLKLQDATVDVLNEVDTACLVIRVSRNRYIDRVPYTYIDRVPYFH